MLRTQQPLLDWPPVPMIYRIHLPRPLLFALDITPLPFSSIAVWTKCWTSDPRLIRDTLNIKIPVIRTRHLMYTAIALYGQYIIC